LDCSQSDLRAAKALPRKGGRRPLVDGSRFFFRIFAALGEPHSFDCLKGIELPKIVNQKTVKKKHI
jgi:hypothetical protein